MKGVINQNIVDMLNLPSLDEVLKEKGVEIEPESEADSDEDMQQAVVALREMTAKLALIEGTDHAESMDDLHKEILTHARDLMSYGFNIDHPRARGIFEVAATMYSHAISTKNSKRDAQLKSMKLALDKKRVELEETRTHHAVGQQTTTLADDGTILVEDRNELLKLMRDKMRDKTG